MTAVDMMAGVDRSLPVSYLDDPFGAQIPPFTPLHLVVEKMRVFFVAPMTQTALESGFEIGIGKNRKFRSESENFEIGTEWICHRKFRFAIGKNRKHFCYRKFRFEIPE